MADREFVDIDRGFSVRSDYRDRLAAIGLTSLDAVFEFKDAENLSKPGLADYRSRLRFRLGDPPVTAYLKRYNHPPVSAQIKTWRTSRGRTACALAELKPTLELAALGIATPEIIAYGCEWGALFERRSFIISREIPQSEALERRLPACFSAEPAGRILTERREFIAHLADFVARFHRTGYRHRDLYLSHIFCSDDGALALIDLARAFKPALTGERYRLKDIAQLHYSCPGTVFSRTDRLRFYLTYTGIKRLRATDKRFIRNVLSKALRMARHDLKRGRSVPFMDHLKQEGLG